MRMMKLLATAALVAIGTAAAPADAAQYLVNYTSQYTIFSATVTTNDVADANGFYTITDMIGTRNGTAITLLAAGNLYSDRLFKPTDPFVDDNGFTYESNGDWINVFNSTADADGVLECFAPPGEQFDCLINDTVGFTVQAVTPTGPAVPEPATWAMMVIGFGALGGALRRRQQVHVRFA